MTAKKAPPVCTVDVDQFKQLVRDVARASDTDPSLPMINGVLLHGDMHDKKPVLVGTATDRFILAHGSVDATGAPLPEVFIRLPAEGANKVAVKPELLTRIAAIAKARHEPMRIHAAGSNRVTTVQIGPRFRALIMPVKVNELDVLPVFAPKEASKERAA